MPEHDPAEQPVSIAPEPVPGLPLSDATIEAAPPGGEEQPPPPARAKPKLIEPSVGQRVALLVPERKDARGRPIEVIRPGTPRRCYQTGEVVRWDDHMVFLRQEGALFATEIEE